MEIVNLTEKGGKFYVGWMVLSDDDYYIWKLCTESNGMRA